MAKYRNYTYYDYLQHFSLPLYFSIFLAVVFFFFTFTWYINYESKVEDFMFQLKIILMIIPIVLLLLVHLLSADDRWRVPFAMSLPEKDALHRAGGSPWGVAALLVFLLYMISFQSKAHESWFPFSR